MLILLPPSESKRERRRGTPMDLDSLSFPELNPARRRVMDALGDVSAGPGAAAALGVSEGLLAEVARNVRLDRAPALPVEQLYDGVLYDALDLDTLDAAARRRARRQVVVTSALYGAVRLRDRVAPYRLSMSVRLDGPGPLAAMWRAPLDPVLTTAAGSGLVMDCRSSTYVAAWTPRGRSAERWVQVRVPGATHLAKHTRGLLTRHLCSTGKEPRSPHELESVAAGAFATRLTEPARAGRPWVLDVWRP